MSMTRLILAYAVLAALSAPLAALAQQPQAPASGAAPPAADTQPSHSNPQGGAGVPRATAQSEAGEPRATAQSEAGEPRAKPSAEAPKADSRPPHGQPAAPKDGKTAIDRLELGTATVTGDREQPKVMYIVPWKKSDIGDLTAKPMNSLVDEILAPVDRDVFKREVIYYRAVEATSQNGAPPKPAPQGEK
jgi:hypothetical protein